MIQLKKQGFKVRFQALPHDALKVRALHRDELPSHGPAAEENRREQPLRLQLPRAVLPPALSNVHVERVLRRHAVWQRCHRLVAASGEDQTLDMNI